MSSNRLRSRVAAVVLALVVVLSVPVAPVAADDDDGGLFDGDSSDDGDDVSVVGTNGTNLEVGGSKGVSIGADGVSVGGESGIDADPTEGVSVGGDDGVAVGRSGVSVGGEQGIDADLEDGVTVGGTSGVQVSATEGVSVADGDVVQVAPDGAQVLGQGYTAEEGVTVGESPVAVNGTNVELGGGDGISVGSDGLTVGGDDGVGVGTEGVEVGEGVGVDASDGVQVGSDGIGAGPDDGVQVGGGDGIRLSTTDVGVGDASYDPTTEGVSFKREVPLGEQGKLYVSRQGLGNVYLRATSPEGPQGVQSDFLYASEAGGDGFKSALQYAVENDETTYFEVDSEGDLTERTGLVIAPQVSAGDGERTYLDLGTNITASEAGIDRADVALYSVNESGVTITGEVSRDYIETRLQAEAAGEPVAFVNANHAPFTKRGNLGAGVFPGTGTDALPGIPVLKPALQQVLPGRLGAGIECTGQECLVGTEGVNETIPSTPLTDPIKKYYPLPQRVDTTGYVLPCNTVVGPEDLPEEELPGLTDLPPDLVPGLPTQILSNEAVLGLAYGVVPAPCDVSKPLLEPVADPATPYEEYQGEPTFETDGAQSFQNGISALRTFEAGLSNGGPGLDGTFATVLDREKQDGVLELSAGDEEYEYAQANGRLTQQDGVVTGSLGLSLRGDESPSLLGVDVETRNELGVGNSSRSVTVDLFGSNVGVSLDCDATTCQPDYDGLPKLGALPEIPIVPGGGN
ncbi:hypothetical protein [Haloglomus halophilum]|uniref:hypothetical protein n=1 Tax=Haloglomus halophilum TaxID=2962672 RepID=UPI0020C9BE54|nr:hypothetical protein [Haloglomus halophilum]